MPRKQHTYHYIYKTTCKINGKYYVGMHSTSNLEDGYIGSGKRLWNSIRKHGRENHEIEILEWFPDRSSLKDRERELVNESLLQDLMCMNLKLGGEGGFDSSLQSILGKRSNEKRWSIEENVEKQRKVFSDWCTNAHKEGKLKAPDWTGKFHREETKRKIGESNSLKQKGERNSQFGKRWIHNIELKQNKRIGKSEEIPLGWNVGRKMNFGM